MSENTRINLKHYIGKPFRSDAFAIVTAIALGIGGGTGIGVGLHNVLDTAPDLDGTAQQETAFQELSAEISAIGLEKAQIEIAQKQHELGVLKGTLTGDAATESADAVAQMQKDLALQSYGTLLDLFNHGTQGAEADVSEAQFVELAQAFEKTAGSTEAFGLELNADNAAYLDEARIEAAKDGELTGNPVADAQVIHANMKSSAENPEVLGGFAGMISGIGLMFLMLFAGMDRLQDWSYEDKRVARRPKKQKGLNH
ncbi:MAG: hypothetical protein HND56_09865 [Pseudomonadota bacterium]|nr:hypothetical protein [Pseudomonadota bacterium]QKK05976.1 MAG: hypothetical protein HND56_09865 [Pseudomonadota bacterium]